MEPEILSLRRQRFKLILGSHEKPCKQSRSEERHHTTKFWIRTLLFLKEIEDLGDVLRAA